MVEDLDLDHGRVWLHGNERHREPRWGSIDDWGGQRLEARVRDIDGTKTTPLLSAATASRNARQASTNSLIRDVLVFAGLVFERDNKPASLAAWAGRRVFDETGEIQAVALAMGVRSLDAAARHIGWAWA